MNRLSSLRVRRGSDMLTARVGYAYGALADYRARYYSSDTGRFISEDPIRYGGGVSFYPYVGNHPTSFADPSGLIKHRIGPPTNKYDCLAWGLGLNWVWITIPPDGNPNKVLPHFGCKQIDCQDKVDCKWRAKVKVFEDLGKSINWHVERQTCDKGWTSKNGSNPMFDLITDPDADYAKVYKPTGTVKTTCWSCFYFPPFAVALPDSPDIKYEYH